MSKLGLIAVPMLFAAMSFAQAGAPAASDGNVTAPPKVVLLVFQQFLPGRAGARQTLEIDTAQNFDRLNVPVTWIELESLTGPPQAMFFDPANSFADLDKAGVALAQFYRANPDLAQNQQRIDDTVSSSRTVTAFRREDLSSQPDKINLAKARYLRVRVVQVAPSNERNFSSAVSAAAKEKPWAAYQVNAGFPDITFLFVETLQSMQDVDQSLGKMGAEWNWLGAASSSEVTLYALHPEMSHVSKEFAAADPYYWGPRGQ